MSLMVIGTGFGRTGTDLMREALTILGFGPCHHMWEVMAHAEQKRLWRALAKGDAPDWAQLFAGYKSCVDWPSAFYWRELIEAYPQARVILTWLLARELVGEFRKDDPAGDRRQLRPGSLWASRSSPTRSSAAVRRTAPMRSPSIGTMSRRC
ncbi:sulfotransferase family protein [Mesorhizobium atlanticum]